MTGKDYVGVLTVLRDQIESGFVVIAPQDTEPKQHEQWKKMFIESLGAGIASLSNSRPKNS